MNEFKLNRLIALVAEMYALLAQASGHRIFSIRHVDVPVDARADVEGIVFEEEIIVGEHLVNPRFVPNFLLLARIVVNLRTLVAFGMIFLIFFLFAGTLVRLRVRLDLANLQLLGLVTVRHVLESLILVDVKFEWNRLWRLFLRRFNNSFSIL